MCRSSALTEMRKFIMMCEYCLEDQIKTFPVLSMPYHCFKVNTSSIQNLLFDYWYSYLTNALHTIPLGEFSCVEAAVAAECDINNWSAFEYFWDRLSVADQISVARWKLSKYRCGISIQHRILSKMSWYQQRVLLDEMSVKIIIDFFNTKYSTKGVLWAWKHTKYRTASDQFIDLIFHLKERNKAEHFLVLIWDTIPDHLRDTAFDVAERQLDVLFEVIKPSCTHFSLLCKYYPQKSNEFWKNLILNHVPHFANYSEDPEPMHEFVKLCLPDAGDLSKFKKSLAEDEKMKYSCQRLFGGGNLEYVDLKLKFCSPSVRAAREYKKNLLIQIKVFEKVIYFTNVRKWRELSAFIDDTFAEEPSMAFSKKRMYISLYANTWPHKYDSTDYVSIERMAKVVELAYLGDEEGLKTTKRAFLNSFLRLPMNPYNRWRQKFTCEWLLQNFVLSWCLDGDEKAIRSFKNTTGYGI